MTTPTVKLARSAAVLLWILLLAGAAQAQESKSYWRLDAGAGIATDAGLKDKTTRLICADAACGSSGELNDLGNSTMIALGAGYHFSSWTRFDLTFSYRRGFQLNDTDGFPATFQGDIQNLSLMANGYVDFAMSWGKPYLGVGVGAAYNKIDPIVRTQEFPRGTEFGNPLTGIPSGKNSGLAWSVMGGIGWQLSGGTILDLGYRYVDLGKLETAAGPTECLGGVCTPVSYGGMSGHLRVHEIAIGFRY